MEMIERIAKAYGLRPQDVIWLCNALIVVKMPSGTEHVWSLEVVPTYLTHH